MGGGEETKKLKRKQWDEGEGGTKINRQPDRKKEEQSFTLKFRSRT